MTVERRRCETRAVKSVARGGRATAHAKREDGCWAAGPMKGGRTRRAADDRWRPTEKRALGPSRRGVLGGGRAGGEMRATVAGGCGATSRPPPGRPSPSAYRRSRAAPARGAPRQGASTRGARARPGPPASAGCSAPRTGGSSPQRRMRSRAHREAATVILRHALQAPGGVIV